MVWVGGRGLCAGPRLPLLYHLRPWPHPSSLMLEQCQSAGFKSPCIDSCFSLGIHTCASIPFLIVCLLQGACPESSGSARTPQFCIYFPMPMTIFITHQTVLRWCVSLLKWPGCPKKASSLSYWLLPAGLNVGYSSHGAWRSLWNWNGKRFSSHSHFVLSSLLLADHVGRAQSSRCRSRMLLGQVRRPGVRTPVRTPKEGRIWDAIVALPKHPVN